MVTVADSDIESIAEAGSHIGQLASQSNADDQNQEANSDGGAISQSQFIDGQTNSSSQDASSNSATAGSAPVTITAVQDIGVTGPDSQIKSIAKAGVGVGQEADQSNDSSQSQTAESDDGDISQSQSHDGQANGSSQQADINRATANSQTVSISAGDGHGR